MNRRRARALALVMLAACAPEVVVVVPPVTAAVPVTPPPAPRFDYPPARRTDDADVMHGVRLPDPYRWLEQDSDETAAWFAAEDTRARRELAKLDGTKDLVLAMGKLFRDPLPRLPTKRGKRAFTQKGDVLRLLEDVPGASERVLFTAPAGVRLTSFVPSKDGAAVFVELSRNGADLRSGQVVDAKGAHDELAGLEDSNIVWMPPDAKTAGFFYGYAPVGVAHADRFANREIRFHALGTAQATDRVVVPATHDKDASSSMNPLAVTKDGTRLLVRTLSGWAGATFALVDLGKPSWPSSPLGVARGKGQSPVIVENTVFAVARSSPSAGGAGSIVRYKPGSFEPETLAPAPAELLWLSVHGTTLAVVYAAKRDDPPNGGFLHRDLYDASFKKLASTTTPRGATDSYFAYPDSPNIIVTREGLGIPAHRLELDPRTGELSPLVPSKVDWDASAFTLETLTATSKDLTRIPITVLRRKDTAVDGTGKLALYGYGGFQNSVEQIFYPPWMVWAAGQGRIFAQCHTRGGMEYGEPWHEAGAVRNRQRTLEDLHACLEELHRQHYATPAHTVTQGWSHGGLLATAAALQRPDLQRVVLALAPLEDMIRFPLYGRGGVSEYGDPDNAADFAALLGFSPYQNIREGVRYPTFFVTAPSKDERVHPMHPRKLTAALQHASTGGEVLLKVLWDAGHLGGAKDDANEVLLEGLNFALHDMTRP